MNNQIILLLLIGSLMTTSCGIKKTPLTPEQSIYAGKWVSNDGTWIQIYNDGTGNLKTGNTSVNGGKTTFKDGNIEIGLFGINKTFKIDQPPFNEDGRMKMKLNGFVYEKVNY